MNQIYPTSGLVKCLQSLLAGTGAGNGLLYYLFSNNFTVTDATVLGDLSGGNCTPQPQLPAAFTLSGTSGSSGYVQAPLLAIPTAGGGGPYTYYGYFATDPGGTQLLLAANFDVPIMAPVPGFVNVIPLLVFSSQF